MKVALLNDKLDAGGAEKVLVNMANLLHRHGVDVQVILFLEPSVLDHFIHPDIPVVYLKREGRFDFKAMLALKKQLKGVHIAHVHSRYNLRYLITAKLFTGIRTTKIVFHEHIPVLSVDLFTKYCLHKTDAYVAVLKNMCEWVGSTIKLKGKKVFYLPNIVNAPKHEIERQPVGSKIIMVGNYWHFKNQLFAINLLNHLPSNYTLDIYGAINDKDYHQDMLHLIQRFDLQSRVKLIEGVSEIYSVLENYNFAIHTSPQETGPLVLLEYMHAGLPFLTYNTGDVVANIESILPYLILDSFDLEKWQRAIHKVMGDENIRAEARAKMKVIIREKYSEEGYWKNVKSIYQSILN